MYTIKIVTESTKCGQCFGGPKGSFSAKRCEITCKKDLPKKFINEFNFKSHRDHQKTNMSSTAINKL
jgi:hypothetical protein